jgi:hypothetical protein
MVDGGELTECVREASFDAVADDDAGPRCESAQHVGGSLGGRKHPNILGTGWLPTRCYGV